jgi:hypothetical protein
MGWTRIVAGSAAAGVLVTLFWLGPLPRIYSGRNDFTNDKALQASYGPLSATHTYGGFARLLGGTGDGAGRAIPAFYRRLAAETGCDAVIEYPFPIGDIYSVYFLYQVRHQKRVLGGYFHAPSMPSAAVRPGVVHAEWPIDRVLGEVADTAKLGFRNLVDLGNARALRTSAACYLVVHTNLESELDGTCRGGDPVGLLGPDWPRRFGEPVFVDECTTVFDLRSLPE